MIFAFTLLSLLFLPNLSLKEIKSRRCINFKHFIEEAKSNKYALLIKDQINDVYSLMNGFGKMYKEKYKKKCIFNKKEVEEVKVNETEIEEDFDNEDEDECDNEDEDENKTHYIV